MIDLSKIRIDFPRDKDYAQDDPCFLEHFRLLCEELSAPNAIRAACFHEAGHLIYFRRLGATLNYSPDEFQFIRPNVSYRWNKQTLRCEFSHAIAETRTPFNKENIGYTDETLRGLAKACFAGGVFTDEFARGSARGDGDDHCRFHCYYVSAIKQRGVMQILETQLRDQAIIAIIADLRDAQNRKDALTLADQLELRCFS